ncbi:Do family serine endopeptidase [Otariodibacter oris]|uniref:Serine protease DegQ n=1 Tax=Otariodibacter oris TaxID=1032623 RepID=A0A420XH68_9PAST|nr:Do family serine endopeptidase [Otariodibacter oris]QGM81146.1 serine peptidase [Otariodibacter oris]RKR72699.1 serine protease DegQ [Otariodibacter oris]
MKKLMKKSVITSLVLGLSVLSVPTLSQASLPTAVDGQSVPSLAPMLEKVRPAVVSIVVEGKRETRSSRADIPDEFEFFFGPDAFNNRRTPPRAFKGEGSGAIINADKGYVVTNNHVIDNADKITVKLEDGREFQAKLIGSDPLSDVALVQIEEPKDLVEIKIADSDKLRVGDFTVAIGNPFGLGQTVTSGIVSALGRTTGNSDEGYESYIQTDAAVNRGNSGGPLINLQGELIGINTAIISPNGGNAGIAFAIPSNMANNLVQQIIEFGEVKRGLLGIKGGELNADLAKAFNVNAQQGAFVSEVLADSAASKAGLKAGDVIVALNGQKIRSFAELRAKVATTGAGKEIEVTYLRDGKEEKAKVTLQSDELTKTSASTLLPALRGAEFNNYDDKGIKGVEISSVEKGSPAEMRGFRKGDVIIGVNRREVTNIGELRKILDSKPSAVALNILRDGSNLFVIIQ